MFDIVRKEIMWGGRKLSLETGRIARQAGVSVAEWRILATLTGGDPLPVGQLAATVIAPQPTVTRQLDRMVGKGLVERMEEAAAMVSSFSMSFSRFSYQFPSLHNCPIGSFSIMNLA